MRITPLLFPTRQHTKSPFHGKRKTITWTPIPTVDMDIRGPSLA
jgi:hypothetical protein